MKDTNMKTQKTLYIKQNKKNSTSRYTEVILQNAKDSDIIISPTKKDQQLDWQISQQQQLKSEDRSDPIFKVLGEQNY